MVEYLQRCGFDPSTWLLLFAVIMDIRPGYVDHRGCVPHTQALWSLNIFGGLGTIISTVCTCFLGRHHGVGPDACGNTWSDKMGCRDFGTAYCAPVPFSALLLLRRKQKTAAQRVCSVPLYALTVLTKATPGYAGGEKELIARGGVDKKKSPS